MKPSPPRDIPADPVKISTVKSLGNVAGQDNNGKKFNIQIERTHYVLSDAHGNAAIITAHGWPSDKKR